MRFKPGDRVRLKNDPACVGVVMEVRAEAGMVRYLVFHSAHEIREYNEEQLERVGDVERWRICGFEEFLARFAAASLLDPVTDFFYTWGTGGRIDFVPHQFKPVLRFLRSPYRRLLIADETGVGKTIEAGLILKEMEARQRVRR